MDYRLQQQQQQQKPYLLQLQLENWFAGPQETYAIHSIIQCIKAKKNNCYGNASPHYLHFILHTHYTNQWYPLILLSDCLGCPVVKFEVDQMVFQINTAKCTEILFRIQVDRI